MVSGPDIKITPPTTAFGEAYREHERERVTSGIKGTPAPDGERLHQRTWEIAQERARQPKPRRLLGPIV